MWTLDADTRRKGTLVLVDDSIEAAQRILDGLYGGSATHLAECGRGEWSVAYGFRTGAGERVLRIGRHREDFEKDRIAAAWASPDLPVPAVRAIGETADGDGVYCVSDRVYGTALDALDAAAFARTLPSLMATIDAMRRADVSATRGYGQFGADGSAPFASWREALLEVAIDAPRKRVHGWREKIAASRFGIADFDEAAERFSALVERCPEERHLIHADMFNRNVFVHDDKITGVIDWGCGMYGDFLYDIAQFWFWSQTPWFDKWRGIDVVGAAERWFAERGVAVPAMRARLRCYAVYDGLGACAYNAYRERWDELTINLPLTLALARGD